MPAASALPLQGTDTVTEHVTCLGCGCTCNDIRVTVREGQITATEHACELGTHWFGEASTPTRTTIEGREASIEDAIEAAAKLLARTNRPLVYLADDLSCESQRVACGIADVLRGVLENPSAATVSAGITAAQARGRATATLGEIRHRADVVMFWGVDPTVRYPRFIERYLSRSVSQAILAIDIGTDRGPTHAAARYAFEAKDEITLQSQISAAIKGRPAAVGAAFLPPGPNVPKDLVAQLSTAQYIALITDGEPRPGRDAERAEGMLVLAEALNARSRCALITLRAGGNRMGAESVMTWQTGYPMSVDFTRGVPRYTPGVPSMDNGAVLIAGAWKTLPDGARQLRRPVPTVIIGPHASTRTPAAAVAIDTGIAGVHESGMAYRLDDIPLPLTPVIAGARHTTETLRALAKAIAQTIAPRVSAR